ncbi:MAG: FAD-dependent oxidoreductase [Anaerolineae bacterium]|nr:FAD-dependent oxidoreductase [Anaerolineae bacterium]
MSQPGTATNPLRVAIIGAGPTGFYTAEHFFKQQGLAVAVDMFECLPTPFGLVRGGVAPDHQKIKSVTQVFDRIAAHPNFRFYGYVEFGRDVALADLQTYYHQIVFTTGAQTDRSLGIPGEGLRGSHAATEFVAWYNGHPDYRECQFDLSQERVAVIGVGNVAVDVARILCHTPEELAQTDIADYALEALSQSRVKEVTILGRRGPAQAAFTNPEIKELGELSAAEITVLPEEIKLDPLSQATLVQSNDRATLKKIEILQAYTNRQPNGKSRRLTVRFLVSPVELIGNEAGQVVAMRLVKNELYVTGRGDLRSRATDKFEELPVGLVFRSVGYCGVPLPGVPFDEKWGIIPNERGRVINPASRQPVVGLYAAGWIKRGPSGIIGTNKPDALETINCMLEDLVHGRVLTPSRPDVTAAEAFVHRRQPNYFSYQDWRRLDELEVARGQAVGRPRVKFTKVEDMLVALGRRESAR